MNIAQYVFFGFAVVFFIAGSLNFFVSETSEDLQKSLIVCLMGGVSGILSLAVWAL